ncbi:hypothetical protein GGR53DRAFT_467844 [Hypoxylon sp. FL1150]|nr:hypothetical protein GGR53DRAFT_467844 [Hypoxylon sp. FL1150]
MSSTKNDAVMALAMGNSEDASMSSPGEVKVSNDKTKSSIMDTSSDQVKSPDGEAGSSTTDTSSDVAVIRRLYSGFPPELKMKVWEQAAMYHGVHHFQITSSIRRDEDQASQDVIVTPMPAATDTSVWRVRNSLKWTDAYSREVLSRKLEEDVSATRQFWPRDERILTEAQPVRQDYQVAIVNLATDLVVFKFTGMVMRVSFMPMQPWQEFRGVKRVGLSFHHPTTHRRPFGCPCVYSRHPRMSLCFLMLYHFLGLFCHLETFYFMYKINGNTVKFDSPVSPARVSRTTLVRPYMDLFRTVAHREGLEIFEDSKYTYYEVREEDALKRFNNSEVWGVIKDLKGIYGHRRSNKRPNGVNMKVMVFAEPQDTAA